MSGVDLLNRLGAAWVTLAGVALWQATIVAVVVGVVSFALRRASPALRYWLWQLVPLKLLILPLGTWSLALPWLPVPDIVHEIPNAQNQIALTGQAAASSPALRHTPHRETFPFTAPAETRPEAVRFDFGAITWRARLLMVWAAIVLWQIARLIAQYHRLSQLLCATSPGAPALVDAVGEVARTLRLRHAPQVCQTDMDCSPFVCGVFRPLLVMPTQLLRELDRTELQQVLAHELAHIKRRDLVSGWIAEAAGVLYFFHPAMHWARARIRLERELACDQIALDASGRTAAQYTDTLVRALGVTSMPPAFRAATASLGGGARSEGPREKSC